LRPSVSYFQIKGATDGSGKEPAGIDKVWSGTGVSVAKEDHDCLVVTDDHVPKGVPQQHVKSTDIGVVMANGQTYEGTVVTSDPAHDLALVKVNTGADTDKVCKAAAVVDKPAAAGDSGSVMTMGQPFTSHSIYTSIGSLGETSKRSSINYMIPPLPGEDPNRDILSDYVPTREGFSGAALFNKEGQVVAIDDVSTSPFTSVATPINRAIVDDLIARRTDKPNP
jgi:S1-C subfamily serine protease